jgi:hypothetical protein
MLNVTHSMKNAKQNWSPANNKQHKKIENTSKKIKMPSKPHGDQLSIILALSTSPNQRNHSSIRSLHHLDAHIEKRKHIFLLLTRPQVPC